MNIKTLQIIVVVIFLISSFSGTSQSTESNYPEIGKPVPEFRLTNVHNYSQKTFDPTEVKDKWVVIDFWYKGCLSCVQSFPKLNKLQNEFKGQIQFMLIGKNDKKNNEGIELVFDRYRKRLGLNLPSAFDSVLYKQFGIDTAPHVIVIDPQKNVYAITYSDFLNRENLQALIDNKTPAFKKKYNVFENDPANSIPVWKYLINENEVEQEDVIYRSILSASKSEEPVTGAWQIDQFVSNGLYQRTRISLSQLYNVAYLGEAEWGRRNLYFSHWKYPVLEIKDSSAFQFNYHTNRGFYNYSLIVPKEKATRGYLMEMVKGDLKDYFGYEVSIETRMKPCWILTATEEARKKLKTKSGSYYGKYEVTGIEGKRVTVESILSSVEMYNNDERIPFFDGTNIKEKIDINLSVDMNDIDAVRKALRKHGLILEKDKKEMKVLVIRDPEALK